MAAHWHPSVVRGEWTSPWYLVGVSWLRRYRFIARSPWPDGPEQVVESVRVGPQIKAA